MKQAVHLRLRSGWNRQAGVICLLLFLAVPSLTQAQLKIGEISPTPYGTEWSIGRPDSVNSHFSPSGLQAGFSHLPDDGIWLPAYARENPAGHAPLCRIETSLEKKMSIPVWIRAGKMDALPQAGTGNLYLRMKLLRF